MEGLCKKLLPLDLFASREHLQCTPRYLQKPEILEGHACQVTYGDDGCLVQLQFGKNPTWFDEPHCSACQKARTASYRVEGGSLRYPSQVKPTMRATNHPTARTMPLMVLRIESLYPTLERNQRRFTHGVVASHSSAMVPKA